MRIKIRLKNDNNVNNLLNIINHDILISSIEYKVNKKLIIISNSSKRKHSTAVRLSDFGYRKIYFLECTYTTLWQKEGKTNKTAIQPTETRYVAAR